MRTSLATLALGVCVAVVFGAWLGRLDLLNPDEARHAEIAREMLASGSFLRPQIQGLPYYDKPVFFHWTLAASMHWLGLNAGAARLPSVLSALVVLAAAAWWARRAYSPATSLLAVMLLATTPGFVVLGRYVLIDMMLTAALTAALAWLGMWLLDTPGSRRSIYPFYVLVGVGVLIKGPIAAVLAGFVAITAVMIDRRPGAVAELKPVRGGLLVLAVAAPWYLAAWWTNPEYIETFLWHHNVERFTGGGGLTHEEPWFYYGWALPLGLLPWSILVPSALASRLRADNRTRADLYCIAWAATVVLFFSASRTKLPTYMAPAFPPLLCLAAAYANDVMGGSAKLAAAVRGLAGAWTVVVGLCAAAVLGYVGYEFPALAPRLLFTLPALLASALAWRALRRGHDRRLLAQLALASAALVIMAYGLCADVINSERSQREAARVVAAELPATTALASYRTVPHALAFYSQRLAPRFRDRDEAAAWLLSGDDAVLLTETKFLSELGMEPLPEGISELWRNNDGIVVLVSRRRGGSPTEGSTAASGGEGRESNPPPTVEAGITVLKTGRATGPVPSPHN